MRKKKKSYIKNKKQIKPLTKKLLPKKKPKSKVLPPTKHKKKLKVKICPPIKPKKKCLTAEIIPVVIPVIEVPVEESRKKRRKKNPSRMYFTQDTEDAIILYNKDENLDTREVIFRERILFPFQKLVENVFNTFKFSYFETGPLDVQKECLSHLVANMHKYQKKKGKAFSYFSIIAKHYLILLNNTNYKKFNQNIEISDERDEHTIQLQHVDKHHAKQELTDFIRLIVEFWENNVGKIFNKQRDLNIANAVIELFRNSDRIDAYNKKALYLYIREMAMCKTQQITKVINKMKQYHNTINRSYTDDGVVNTERYSTV
jgi:hypothetical protein